MKDLVIYRLPQEQFPQIKRGEFAVLHEAEKPLGFVVSDFLHDRIFHFRESKEQEAEFDFHYREEVPVVISRRDYQIEAQAFLNSFPLLGVEKGVFSRVKAVPFEGEKAFDLFRALEKAYPNAFCYLISSAEFGTWIGATPELLMNQQGMVCKTVALAGTHGENEEHDWTPKELEEHAFVVDAIKETLERNECVEIEANGPYVVNAGPVQHLKTDFRALLTRPNAWSIALDLHPTPAVCGTPRRNAMEAIATREMHDRGLYTGFIGYFEEGNTNLFVNLRCAQLTKDKAFLYVGGGFTVDSIPDLEWDETEHKAETLIRVMKQI
ncbi:chorismate-binding protein [Fluviicola sp.]|uniref:chorismate-binding protein n=1 Tax=Fluviicola sp. TaxID=1917219 RepID=UPI0031D92172